MILTEKEAENLLEKEGFRVVNRQIIKNKKELKKLKLNFPLVAKISSRHIMHKAKIGGTLLNIKNAEEAEKAMENLCRIKGCEAIMFQEMLYGQEIILGLKNTPEFKQVILAGKGGSKVEEERDVSFRVLPIDEKDAESMLDDLKIKVKNKKEVIKNILKLSKLSDKYKIEELDINPLIITEREAVVADARIVIN